MTDVNVQAIRPDNLAALSALRLPELQALAAQLGISGSKKLRKGELVAAIDELQNTTIDTPAESDTVETGAAETDAADTDGSPVGTAAADTFSAEPVVAETAAPSIEAETPDALAEAPASESPAADAPATSSPEADSSDLDSSTPIDAAPAADVEGVSAELPDAPFVSDATGTAVAGAGAPSTDASRIDAPSTDASSTDAPVAAASADESAEASVDSDTTDAPVLVDPLVALPESVPVRSTGTRRRAPRRVTASAGVITTPKVDEPAETPAAASASESDIPVSPEQLLERLQPSSQSARAQGGDTTGAEGDAERVDADEQRSSRGSRNRNRRNDRSGNDRGGQRQDAGRGDEGRTEQNRPEQNRPDQNQNRADQGRDQNRAEQSRAEQNRPDQNRPQTDPSVDEQSDSRSAGGRRGRGDRTDGARVDVGRELTRPDADRQQQDADLDRGGRGRYRDRKRRGPGTGDEFEPEIADDDVLIPVAGILDVLDNYAFVRTSGYLPGNNDVYVSLGQVKKYNLRKGDAVVGAIRQPRDNDNNGRQKYNAIVKIDSVNGLGADQMQDRVEFGSLTPLYPQERLRLETDSAALTGRIIDLVAPIGKGQRGLIVSPPKAGKTLVLQAIANAIAKNNPEVHLMVVLVDERPEEVTDMQRTVKGEVIASTFDRPAEDHTTVAELAIERAKRLVELGHDVVVLLDSITRLGRAYNLAAPASGRILSGGVDSSALYPPKRFFGAARNIENGGSLTILATALVETGSKMDEVIFEEFKGTGNMELRLSRQLADKRIFPSVDVNASGTRREEMLMGADETKINWKLRRALAGLDTQPALELVLSRLKETSGNVEFLMQVQKSMPHSAGQEKD